MKLTLEFGALCDPIAKQLRQQGVTFVPKGELEHFQLDHDALVRVTIKGYVSAAEKRRAQDRLMKVIFAEIQKHMPLP